MKRKICLGLIFYLATFLLIYSNELQEIKINHTKRIGIWEESLSYSLLNKDYEGIKRFANLAYSNEMLAMSVLSDERVYIRVPFENKVDSWGNFFDFSIAIRRAGIAIGRVDIILSPLMIANSVLFSPGMMAVLLLIVSMGFALNLVSEKEKSKIAKLRAEAIFHEQYATMARQTAHDIRSPLSALNMLARTAKGFTTEQTRLLENVIQRINGLSEELLARSRDHYSSITTNNKKKLDFDIIDSITHVVSEKKVENRNISIDVEDLQSKLFVQGDFLQFQSMISNILNNSIEASNYKGKIRVDISSKNKKAIVKVVDNGVGLDESILTKLKSGETYTTKVKGNGLGVKHAYDTARSLGGSLNIKSSVGRGTEVEISLPTLD